MSKIITYSEISCLSMCPRKHNFQYVRCLSPKSRSIFLDESTAAHEALECFYKGGTSEDAIDAFDEVYDRHINMLEDLGRGTKEAIERFLRIRALTVAYFDHVGEKDRTMYDFSHVEQEFNVPVFDPKGNEVEGVRFCGKMDGIWTQKMGRKLKNVVEHKFFSSFDETRNTLMLDLQVTLYAMVAQTMFGVEVPITLYNVARKPANTMRAKESHDDFYYRVLNDHVLKNPDSYFSRVPVTRGRRHFQEARKFLYHGAMILTGRTPLPYVWRNIGQHCLFLCSYRHICLEETPRTIMDLFEVREKVHPELSIEEE
jgi:hypothetical protein